VAIDHSYPNVGQLRAVFSPEMRLREWRRAAVVWLPSMAFYLLSIVATVAAPWWLWPPLVAMNSLGGALLFILSHDAAHDALTPSHLTNQILARLSFLPSWHPHTGWVHAHNHVHHGWTNFQPKDYVWAPMSYEQYQARSTRGRAWVRFCRWWPGFGFYYIVEVLWKKIWLPQPETKRRKTRLQWLADDALMIGLIAAQSAGILVLAAYWQVTTPAWLLILGTQIVPFVACNWLIAFVTYLQHTHPSIPWFQKIHEWSFYMGQVRGTVHTRFPRGINGWIYNIMEHTAHHVDPRIPLYHLPPAQERLQAEHHPVNHKFTWRSFTYTQRVCQLYDFTNHRWQSFAGEATSVRTIETPEEKTLNTV